MTKRALLLLLFVACDKGGETTKPAASVTASASVAASATPSATATASVADPLAAITAGGPSLREEAEVTVDGVKEKWRLEWTSTPSPSCVDEKEVGSLGSGSVTCSCAGFAFGEKGDLDLVRAQPGKAEERMHLGPLFDGGKARLQRWPVGNWAKTPPSLADLAMRPLARVMKIADYDHDGRATEFVLQVDANACGHTPSVVVGISKNKPSLHAFATTDKPSEPLKLDRRSDWDKLAAKSPVSIVEVACGDHGADTETSLDLSADGELHAKEKTRKCP